MDCKKIGNLIFNLRKEKNLTQKALADAMNISDRTISKWERGIGCPDISLLNELSNILEVNVEKILEGDLSLKDADGGNMKKAKFYVCPSCGNTLYSTGEGDFSCCVRKLSPLVAKLEDEQHQMNIEEIENDYYITFNHDMSKSHYVSFFAYVAYDRVLLIKLYPEQAAEVRFPKMYGGKGKFYCYCSEHGLIEKEKKKK